VDLIKRLYTKSTQPLPSPSPPEPPAEASNPWNADTPKSYTGMWIGCKTTQRRINRKVSGDPSLAVFDYQWATYGAHLPASARCLILGANEGWMERALRQKGFHGYILATDIAEKALARARAASDAAGYRDIEYRVADLNTDSFDGPFDVIIAEGVLHHIERTEAMLRRLHGILAPEGVLFGVEWAGPFRFQLPEAQVRWVNALLAAMPGDLRPQYSGPPGVPPDLKYQSRVHYVPPPEEAIRQMDPSEAITGTALRDLIPKIFEVVEWKGFGGTLLAYMSGHFPFERADTDPYVDTFLEMLLGMEEKVIESGLLQDEFFAFVARRRGHSITSPPVLDL
jgi:SAM-dependent methyltransferase